MQTSLQKREISRALDEDLKEAVSLLKRQDYEGMLKRAHDLVGLGSIEHQVRMDSRLTQGDRIRLLSAVSRKAHIQTRYST
jgi:molybdopterin converting factor small subunit